MQIIYRYFLTNRTNKHQLLTNNNFDCIKIKGSTLITVFKIENLKNFNCHYLCCTKTELRGSKKKRQSCVRPCSPWTGLGDAQLMLPYTLRSAPMIIPNLEKQTLSNCLSYIKRILRNETFFKYFLISTNVQILTQLPIKYILFLNFLWNLREKKLLKMRQDQ